MCRSRAIYGVGGLIALLCVAAACQGYYPCGPVCAETCATKTASVKLAPVNELLDKLEALKAKREAIEQEEKAPRAALMEQLAAQQERLAKLGIVPTMPYVIPNSPVPAIVGVPATSHEPVTTYTETSYYEPVTNARTTRVYDKQTNSFKAYTAYETKYILRKTRVPITTYGQRTTEAQPPPPACQPLPPATPPEQTANPAPPSLQSTPR